MARWYLFSVFFMWYKVLGVSHEISMVIYIRHYLIAGQQMPASLKLKSMTFVDPDVRRGHSAENPPYDFK